MAQDIYSFDCTFNPGGSPTSPIIFQLSMPPRIIQSVEFMIPFGNRGAVKFGLGMAGTVIIPSNSGGFLTGDDTTIHWDLEGYPTSGSWQLFGYNSGEFPHLIEVRFLCRLIPLPGVAPLLVPHAAVALAG
jgi:hypothetical protein